MEIGLDVIAMIVFFGVVAVLLFLDRKNIEFNYGLIIRRWKRGQYVMDKWIFSHRRFLNIVGIAAIVLGFAASIGGIYSIAYATTQSQQAVNPILPTVGGAQYPAGIIGVPFWFWIVSIFVILSVHEPMHAIFARLAGIPVRSWGIMTLLVLPIGAFVDPDMKKIQRLGLWDKIKIFAGGSFGNFVFGAISLAVLVGLTNGLFHPAGVVFASTINDTPAALVGLNGTITMIDGNAIKTSAELNSTLNGIAPGSTISLQTSEGSYTLVTQPKPSGEGSFIGIRGVSTLLDVDPWLQPLRDAVLTIRELFFWLFIFNVGVGVFNMLPMKPFDGGHMFEAIFAKIFKSDRLARHAIHITSIVVLAIILFNVFGTGLVKSLFG